MSTRYTPSPARPLVDKTTEYGTGLQSVTDGVADVPKTLLERVAADPENLRAALEIPAATTDEMESGTETELRAMSPANVAAAIVELSAAVGGSVATDPIFDAAGDLAVGTGPNESAKLSKGTASQVLKVKADGSTLEWANETGGVPTAITVADEHSDTDSFIAFFTGATGDLGPKTVSTLTFNSHTGNLGSTLFNGLTLTAATTGFTVAGGTTSKTLTVPDTASVSGTNTGDNAANTSSAAATSFIAGAGALTGPASPLTIGTAAASAVGDFATAAQGTDARTPTSHAHGNVTNDGKVGSTANLPLKTGTAGVIEAGSFGNTAATFCQGNDTRLALPVDQDVYGFLNQAETSLGFNPAGGTTPNDGLFTLGSVGASWSYYAKGVKYTVTGAKTVVVPDATATTTKYHIYIDNGVTDGTLTCAVGAWDLDTDGKVPVATIIRNSGLTPAWLLGEERHTCKINRRDHMIEHYTGGALYASGGVITGQTINSSTDTNKTCAVTAVKFFDEDIYLTTSAIADGNASSETNYSICYRTGATAWAWARSLVPFKYTTTGAIEFDSAGTMTPATAGNGASKRWVNYFLMACQLNGQESLLWIPGRSQFTSLALANAENFSTFDLTGLPTNDGVAIWRMTWHTDGTGLGLCQLAQAPVRIASNIVTSAVTATTVHNGLSGLQGGTSGEYFHLTEAQATVATQAATASLNGYATSTQITKLDAIAAGAQVNVIEGVTGTAPIVAGAVTAKSQAISITASSTTSAGSAPQATAPSAGLRSVLAIDNGELARSDKALFDATNPADIGTAGPGNAMAAARRDHVHAIPSGHVSLAMMANLAQDSIISRVSSGAGVPEAVTVAEQTLVGRITGGHVDDLAASTVRTLLNVADGANAYVHPNHTGEVTSTADGATVIAANAVTLAKLATQAANTVLANATTGAAVPTAVTVAEQTLVGRLTGGNVDDIAIGIADNSILQVDDASAADNDYAKFTANGIEGVPYATVLSDIAALPLAGGTMTGDITLTEHSSVVLPATLATDHHWCGEVLTGQTAGENLVFGELVSQHTDGEWYKVDCGIAAATAGDARRRLGIVVVGDDHTHTALSVMLRGQARDDSWTAMAIGVAMFASETAGAIVAAQPTTTDHIIRCIGHASAAQTLHFYPDGIWTTHT